MRPFRGRSSGLAASSHMRSSVVCITTTSESGFSVHTVPDGVAFSGTTPSSHNLSRTRVTTSTAMQGQALYCQGDHQAKLCISQAVEFVIALHNHER
jgi:hypothetical protein